MQIRDTTASSPPLIRRRVKHIIWLLLAVSLLILVLGTLQAQLMSGVRAYVRGEGLWAKAQKDSVLLLYRYLENPSDYLFEGFERALQINLNDRIARLALQKKNPNYADARQGFLAGGNHPDDIDNMIYLFVWFQNIKHMKNAIAIWTAADAEIDQLRSLAYRIREAHFHASNADLSRFKQELEQLDLRLNKLEIDFSSELSEGARWLKRTLLLVNLSMLMTMLLLVWFISRRVLAEIDDAESKLRDSETRFKTLYDSNIIGILIWRENGEIYDANDQFLDILGYTRAELQQGLLNWRDLTPAEFQSSDDHALQQIAEQGYCLPFEKEFFHKTGRRTPVCVGGALLHGEQDRGLAFMVDRTSEKKMEAQIQLSATVLEASRDGILICNQQRNIITTNASYRKMTGFTNTELVGTKACFYRTSDQDEAQKIESKLQQRHYWQDDTEIPLANGNLLPVRASIATVTGDDGQFSHYVAVFSDISARRDLEENLKNMAHFDHLTGLANRILFSDRLCTAISRAHRHKTQCALLFIDLDKFKPVNDQYGHAIGDELLKQVALRLSSSSRESDTVGRLGGDEFVMIVEDLNDPDYATQIAEKIAHQLQQPFTVNEQPITVGCSIGIAVYPIDGKDDVELIRAADIAMYAAKGKPDTHYYLYSGQQKN
ncbi:MAG: diguanylate cyclase [Pseudomonadales bacterium]|uniref:sensor domain-containing diguanylate cyclase n=1 Tax=unclassified Ketobacter TaxID=2639109 RepID=UPI000C8C2707|nr:MULTISPECIES: sensor domain-containing diguanylate cyclase [unclassified Ketobacter]MAA59134.1 diguanylate cyclase [Pseudomonadales bacterium]TNC84868.1 MAG: diguanylate cyclase [Alcanivorax sp.]HAG93076.1 diguanylate cyclase [Gammaproteobacteria bacterium]MAQ23742.1 diguanylate cyclase [Pseudomonadales bacterium]RLT87896.1 MAG: diguanylate cyclase [Ketobacter sp. GenoA1]